MEFFRKLYYLLRHLGEDARWQAMIDYIGVNNLYAVLFLIVFAETGLAITVCHFPPGTSKWNTIEHRLFSHISSNWRGQTLTSHEVAVMVTITRRAPNSSSNPWLTL